MSAGSERQRTLTMKNCFNALLFMLVIGITLTISGCSSDAPERSQSDEPQRFESVIVDIQTGGDGYYSLKSENAESKAFLWKNRCCLLFLYHQSIREGFGS